MLVPHPRGHRHAWRSETNRNYCYKSVNLSHGELKNIKIIRFLIKNCSDSQIFRNKSLFNQHYGSLGRYHKTNNPFGANICLSSSFQLLLYIMKVTSQEDQ